MFDSGCEHCGCERTNLVSIGSPALDKGFELVQQSLVWPLECQ
jgi:hypothetical protein